MLRARLILCANRGLGAWFLHASGRNTPRTYGGVRRCHASPGVAVAVAVKEATLATCRSEGPHLLLEVADTRLKTTVDNNDGQFRVWSRHTKQPRWWLERFQLLWCHRFLEEADFAVVKGVEPPFGVREFDLHVGANRSSITVTGLARLISSCAIKCLTFILSYHMVQAVSMRGRKMTVSMRGVRNHRRLPRPSSPIAEIGKNEPVAMAKDIQFVIASTLLGVNAVEAVGIAPAQGYVRIIRPIASQLSRRLWQ